MRNLDDLSNAEGLDESITENYTDDYSNINWKDPLKGAREAAERVAKAAREAAQRAREAAERAAKSARDAAERARDAAQKAAKDLGKNIKDAGKSISDVKSKVDAKAKEVATKARDRAKKIATKARDEAKRVKDKIKETEKRIGKKLKEVAKKIKDAAKKFADKLRNALRKTMRNLILKSIKGNVHGTATRMYAAIASGDELKVKKIKINFANKAKNAYSAILSQWKTLGGSETELNDAIRAGASKRILKNPFNRADGNNHDEFYSYIASEDYFYGADGDTDEELAQADAEKMKADEEAAVVINEDDGTIETPDEGEKVSGFKAFIAKILSLFKKNKADENPYEEGEPEAADFAAQEKADEGNQPNESEADNNEVLNELFRTADEDAASAPKVEEDKDALSKEGSDDTSKEDGDKILGMPKGVAIGLGVAVLAVGGFFAYKYFKGKK